MNSDNSKKQALNSNKKEFKNVEKITKINISVNKQSIEEMAKLLNISWINKGVSDQYYPFKESFEGQWETEVLRPQNKMKFTDIVDICKEEGYSPATIFHVLSFLLTVKDYSLYRSMLAPASLYIDDFESIGCVVVSIHGHELS